MYYKYSCAIYKNTFKFTGYSASRATVPKCTFSCLSLSWFFASCVSFPDDGDNCKYFAIFLFSYFPSWPFLWLFLFACLRFFVHSFAVILGYWKRVFSLPCCLFVSSDKDMLHAVAARESIMLECRCLQHREYVAAGYTSAIVALAATPPQLPPQLPHPWPCDQLLLYNED